MIRCEKSCLCALIVRQIKVIFIGIIIGFLFGDILLSTEEQKEPKELYFHQNDTFHKYHNCAVAEQMAEKIKILCLVMITPDNQQELATTVNKTWGSRCTILMFIGSESNTTLPMINFWVEDKIIDRCQITKLTYEYACKFHLDEVDWVLLASDDTYVILENLRYLLSNYSSLDPLYLGIPSCEILSKEAVKRFVTNLDTTLNTTNKYCSFMLSKELVKVGVKVMDTNDSYGRKRFFSNDPIFPIFSGNMDCCSDTSISFHKIDMYRMWVIEYMVNNLRPFGISYKFPGSIGNQFRMATNS